jgi:hypothetical protein
MNNSKTGLPSFDEVQGILHKLKVDFEVPIEYWDAIDAAYILAIDMVIDGLENTLRGKDGK